MTMFGHPSLELSLEESRYCNENCQNSYRFNTIDSIKIKEKILRIRK